MYVPSPQSGIALASSGANPRHTKSAVGFAQLSRRLGHMHLKQPPAAIAAQRIAATDTQRRQWTHLDDVGTARAGRAGNALLKVVMGLYVGGAEVKRVTAVVEQHLQRVSAPARSTFQPLRHRDDGLCRQNNAGTKGAAAVEQALLAVLRACA